MSVALLNTSGQYGGLYTGVSRPVSHILYDGVNRMVAVWVGGDTSVTPTLNGVNMTNAVTYQSGRLASIWYMLENGLPWEESTISIDFTGGTPSRFGMAIGSFSGVKQQAPYDTGVRFNALEQYPYASYKSPLHGLVLQCNTQDGTTLNQKWEYQNNWTQEIVDLDCHDNTHIGGVYQLNSLDKSGSDYNWRIDWESDALSTDCAGASWEASDYETYTRNPLCVQLGVNN